MMAYTQQHIIACQLCPDQETMLQLEVTDPSDAEYKAAVQKMLTHFKDSHTLTDDECKRIKIRSTAFLDGAQGWAQQHKQWVLLATDDQPERIVAGYMWTREHVKTGKVKR